MNPITYRKVDSVSDLSQLIRLYGEVFEVPYLAVPSPEYLGSLLASENTFFLAAYDGERVVSGRSDGPPAAVGLLRKR